MGLRERLRHVCTGSVAGAGFRLLPHLVKPLLAVPGNAVWLLPTPGFRRAVFDSRGPEWGFLAKTRDPDRALRNLLERDVMFTDRLREETKRLELPAVELDTSMTEDELVDQVIEAFGSTRLSGA